MNEWLNKVCKKNNQMQNEFVMVHSVVLRSDDIQRSFRKVAQAEKEGI